MVIIITYRVRITKMKLPKFNLATESQIFFSPIFPAIWCLTCCIITMTHCACVGTCVAACVAACVGACECARVRVMHPFYTAHHCIELCELRFHIRSEDNECSLVTHLITVGENINNVTRVDICTCTCIPHTCKYEESIMDIGIQTMLTN